MGKIRFMRYIISMKKILILIFSICFFLLSCPEENPSRKTYYAKSFFLGDTSFTFEGETFNDYIPPTGWPVPEPYESVIVRLRPYSFIERYDGWEIPGINLSQNRFRIEINKTANGITIGKDSITNEMGRPYFFPDDFPAVELMFCFNGAVSSFAIPLLRENVRHSRTQYNYYNCYYVFVAEPINLSGIKIDEGQGKFGYYVNTYNNHLNFPKSGWYKIVSGYHSKFNNDPKFSSTKNNYFNF